jgi:transcriptional regulator with XRE-family HTH domain
VNAIRLTTNDWAGFSNLLRRAASLCVDQRFFMAFALRSSTIRRLTVARGMFTIVGRQLRKEIMRVRRPAGSVSGPPTAPYGRGTGIPNPIDIHVGKRIRLRRLLLGMNQETLANALDLTFQQVQKYEGGANRVSASRLKQMAEILDVPIEFFFADLPSDNALRTAEEQEWRERMERPETIELIRLYYAIADPSVRQSFLQMVKSVGDRTPPD